MANPHTPWRKNPDWWMVILTAGALVFAGLSAGVLYFQLKDTHGQLEVAQNEFDAGQKTRRLEQRAWVEVTLVKEKLVKEQIDVRPRVPLLAPLRQTNTGKVPAWNVNSEFVVEIVEARDAPTFNSVGVHFGTFGGVLFPSAHFDVAVPWLLPNTTVADPPSVSKPTYDRLMAGDTYLAIFGKLSYTDAYGDHAQQWCAWQGYKLGGQYNAKSCTDFNALSPN
jgi:hypothetical protein